MTAGDVVAYVIVPLGLFVLGAIATGITLLVKGSTYLARSAAAQESTAASNDEINTTLKAYMTRNDERVNDHERRIYVLEDVRRQGHEMGRSWER